MGVFFERRFQPLSVGGFFSNQRESISRCPKSPFPSKTQNRQIARTSPLKKEETPSSSPEKDPKQRRQGHRYAYKCRTPRRTRPHIENRPSRHRGLQKICRRRPASDDSSSLSNPRPLLLKFKTQPAKIAVMRNKNNLQSSKYSNIYVKDDLTNSERARRRSLVPVYKKLRQARVQCVLRRDKLLQPKVRACHTRRQKASSLF